MRRKLLAPTLVVAAAFAVIAFLWLATDRTRPKFRPTPTSVDIPSYSSLSYDFLSPALFAGGKMWVTTSSGTNQRQIQTFCQTNCRVGIRAKIGKCDNVCFRAKSSQNEPPGNLEQEVALYMNLRLYDNISG